MYKNVQKYKKCKNVDKNKKCKDCKKYTKKYKKNVKTITHITKI